MSQEFLLHELSHTDTETKFCAIAEKKKFVAVARNLFVCPLSFGLGTKFQLRQTILAIWTKFTITRGISPSEIEYLHLQ